MGTVVVRSDASADAAPSVDARPLDAPQTRPDARPDPDAPGGEDRPSLPEKKANGAACADGTVCTSGICADGVCCNEVCTGPCRSCAVPTKSGTCSNVAAGDPAVHEGCADQLATCGNNGRCDGAGACQRYPRGTSCRPGSCSGEGDLAGFACNDQGMCAAAPVRSCGGLRCAAGACLSKCAANGDCVPGRVCLGGTCAPPDTASIPFTDRAPTVDGKDDPVWKNAPLYDIDRLISGSAAAGNADVDGTWRALWNNEALFIQVNVRDNHLENDSDDPTEDDAVELFIDGDESRGKEYDKTNDLHFVFGWNDTRPNELALGRVQGVTMTSTSGRDSYVIEARIPWSVIGVTPIRGGRIGIEIQIDDDDFGGARDGRKAWHATEDRAARDPSLFGTGVLLSP